MSLDVRNPPFSSGEPPFGGIGNVPSDGKGEYDKVLHLDNMLLQEFNYASTTAYQAMEDRARLFNLYLLLVGVLASGLGAAYQLGTGVRLYLPPLAVVLLCVAGILGTAFFLSLIRLRKAHYGSLVCMGIIKEFYIRRFMPEEPHIHEVFMWRVRTAPAPERFGSATYVVCHTVAMIGSLCYAGAAAIVIGLMQNNGTVLLPYVSSAVAPYAGAGLAFVLAYLLHSLYFRRALRSKTDHELERRLKMMSDESGTQPPHATKE